MKRAKVENKVTYLVCARILYRQSCNEIIDLLIKGLRRLTYYDTPNLRCVFKSECILNSFSMIFLKRRKS